MRPPAPPTSSPVTDGIYTADDQEIAKLVLAGADEAIPRLKGLNAMDPGQLEDLFVPLGTWIADQRTRVESYTPSGCTAEAVARFIEGMDAYDDIRARFLAWRDWGAHGHAFHPEAPRQAELPCSKRRWSSSRPTARADRWAESDLPDAAPDSQLDTPRALSCRGARCWALPRPAPQGSWSVGSLALCSPRRHPSGRDPRSRERWHRPPIRSSETIKPG